MSPDIELRKLVADAVEHYCELYAVFTARTLLNYIEYHNPDVRTTVSDINDLLMDYWRIIGAKKYPHYGASLLDETKHRIVEIKG